MSNSLLLTDFKLDANFFSARTCGFASVGAKSPCASVGATSRFFQAQLPLQVTMPYVAAQPLLSGLKWVGKGAHSTHSRD